MANEYAEGTGYTPTLTAPVEFRSTAGMYHLIVGTVDIVDVVLVGDGRLEEDYPIRWLYANWADAVHERDKLRGHLIKVVQEYLKRQEEPKEAL